MKKKKISSQRKKEDKNTQLGLKIKEPFKNRFFKIKGKTDSLLTQLEVRKFLKDLFFWFALLVAGFGAQFGLFTHLKSLAKSSSSDGGPKGHSSEVERGMISANTGLSSVSMVACCAHHLTDVLPFFGLAGLSLFLTRYQVWFLAIGILSNFAGIIYLLRQINKHQAYVQN